MVGNLLLRGMIAGAIAGVLVFVFAHFFGEPLVDQAIASVRAMPAGKGRIRIDVEDNGRGIAVADRERVFELFRRAGEQDQPGEGIGLAYVRSLIRNLGGDITVASTEGTGSTFTLLLPSDLTTIVKGTES